MTLQNQRQQQQDKTTKLQAYEAAGSLKITNCRIAILSPIANASNKPNKTIAQNWRQQQQNKTENLRAYEAARSLKLTNYRTEILSPIENASKKPNKTTENTKEQENMPENSPKSYKNDNSISNESHNVLIENTRRNENELPNQEYIPEKGRYIQPMVVMACILIGVTIVAIIVFLLESVYGARVDLRKEKRKPGNILFHQSK